MYLKWPFKTFYHHFFFIYVLHFFKKNLQILHLFSKINIISHLLNMQSIVQYIKDNLPTVYVETNTEPGSAKARTIIFVPFEEAHFTFTVTFFYVQIKMNDQVFRFGDGIQFLDIKILNHYAKAYLRLIQTYMNVLRFNMKSEDARIEFSLGASNFLLYNLPMISMDLIPNGSEERCVLMQHIISEKNWIPASNEGYPPNPNPFSADEIYYKSTRGMEKLPHMDFCKVCHLLVEKMVG